LLIVLSYTKKEAAPLGTSLCINHLLYFLEIVPHTAGLYARRKAPNLLVLGLLLLLLVIKIKLHGFLRTNSAASYEEILRMQEFFNFF
jgi:hypothetical protein